MFVLFKQKTAYDMRISDWSSDVCSSDLGPPAPLPPATWMRVEADGTTEQKTWWTLPYGPRADEQNLDLQDWIDRVLDSTREAEIGRASWRARGCQYV